MFSFSAPEMVPIIFCANFENPSQPQVTLNSTISFDTVDFQAENWFDLRTSTFRPPKKGDNNIYQCVGNKVNQQE